MSKKARNKNGTMSAWDQMLHSLQNAGANISDDGLEALLSNAFNQLQPYRTQLNAAYESLTEAQKFFKWTEENDVNPTSSRNVKANFSTKKSAQTLPVYHYDDFVSDYDRLIEFLAAAEQLEKKLPPEKAKILKDRLDKLQRTVVYSGTTYLSILDKAQHFFEGYYPARARLALNLVKSEDELPKSDEIRRQLEEIKALKGKLHQFMQEFGKRKNPDFKAKNLTKQFPQFLQDYQKLLSVYYELFIWRDRVNKGTAILDRSILDLVTPEYQAQHKAYEKGIATFLTRDYYVWSGDLAPDLLAPAAIDPAPVAEPVEELNLDELEIQAQLVEFDLAFQRSSAQEKEFVALLTHPNAARLIRESDTLKALANQTFERLIKLKGDTIFEQFRQLTLAIPLDEFLNVKEHPNNQPIKNYTDAFNNLVLSINREILESSKNDLSQRLFTIRKFIALAQDAYNRGNFILVFAISGSVLGRLCQYASTKQKESSQAEKHSKKTEFINPDLQGLYDLLTTQERATLVDIGSWIGQDGENTALFEKSLQSTHTPLLALPGMQTALTFAADEGKNPRMKGLKGAALVEELKHCSTKGHRIATAYSQMHSMLRPMRYEVDEYVPVLPDPVPVVNEDEDPAQPSKKWLRFDISADTPVLSIPLDSLEPVNVTGPDARTFKAHILTEQFQLDNFKREIEDSRARLIAQLENPDLNLDPYQLATLHKQMDDLKFKVIVFEQNFKYLHGISKDLKVDDIKPENAEKVALLRGLIDHTGPMQEAIKISLERLKLAVGAKFREVFPDVLATYQASLAPLIEPRGFVPPEPFDLANYQATFTSSNALAELRKRIQKFEKDYKQFQPKENPAAAAVPGAIPPAPIDPAILNQIRDQEAALARLNEQMTAAENRLDLTLQTASVSWMETMLVADPMPPFALAYQEVYEIGTKKSDTINPLLRSNQSDNLSASKEITDLLSEKNALERPGFLQRVFRTRTAIARENFTDQLSQKIAHLEANLDLRKNNLELENSDFMVTRVLSDLNKEIDTIQKTLARLPEEEPRKNALIQQVKMLTLLESDLRKKSAKIDEDVKTRTQEIDAVVAQLAPLKSWLYQESMSDKKVLKFSEALKTIIAKKTVFDNEHATKDFEIVFDELSSAAKERDNKKLKLPKADAEAERSKIVKFQEQVAECYRQYQDYFGQIQQIKASLPDKTIDKTKLMEEPYNLSDTKAEHVIKLRDEVSKILENLRKSLYNLQKKLEFCVNAATALNSIPEIPSPAAVVGSPSQPFPKSVKGDVSVLLSSVGMSNASTPPVTRPITLDAENLRSLARKSMAEYYQDPARDSENLFVEIVIRKSRNIAANVKLKIETAIYAYAIGLVPTVVTTTNGKPQEDILELSELANAYVQFIDKTKNEKDLVLHFRQQICAARLSLFGQDGELSALNKTRPKDGIDLSISKNGYVLLQQKTLEDSSSMRREMRH